MAQSYIRNSSSSSASVSPTTSESSYRDDSSEIDELDHRSRKLTSILRRNANRAAERKSVLNMVRDRAWLLDDQVKLLENQTATVRRSLARQSCRRKVIIYAAVLTSIFIVINTSIISGTYELVESTLQKIFTRKRHKLS